MSNLAKGISYLVSSIRANSTGDPDETLGKEKDVSNLIAFLASEQSQYITGQVIGVTGGVDLFSF